MNIIKHYSVLVSLSVLILFLYGISVNKALGYGPEDQELKSNNLQAVILGSLSKALNPMY